MIIGTQSTLSSIWHLTHPIIFPSIWEMHGETDRVFVTVVWRKEI